MSKNTYGNLKFYCKIGKFEKLSALTKAMDKHIKTITDEVEKQSAIDANLIREQLAKEYEIYIGSYGAGGTLSDELSSLETTRFKLNKSHGKWYGAPNIHIGKTGKMYHVVIEGQNIRYQEFGTGTVGKRDHYNHDMVSSKLFSDADWGYVKGPKIISNYSYINDGGDLFIPDWYYKAVKKGKITRSDKVWMSPNGITKGIHAGAFVYHTIMWYMDMIGAKRSDKIRLTSHNIKKRVVHILTKDL